MKILSHLNVLALSILAALAVSAPTAPALAQTAPTAAEAANYRGLHLAAYQGDADAVERLAAEAADLDARDRVGRTPAHVAAFTSNDDALRALAAAGADLNLLDGELYDVVTIAAVANDPELVSLAIDLGNRADLITSRYVGTALIAAAHLGHAEVVRRLIAGGAPLDHVNNLGWTALIEAVILGDGGPDHIATVQALLDAGADASIGDNSGVTPLRHAEIRGYDRIANLIRAAQPN